MQICKLCNFAILCCFWAGCALTTAAQTPTQLIVTAQAAVIRSLPSTKGKVLGTVKKNAVLDVYAAEPVNKWYLITDGKLHGWISGKLTTLLEGSDKIASPTGKWDPGPGWEIYGPLEARQAFHKSAITISGSVVRVWDKKWTPTGQLFGYLAIDCAKFKFLLLQIIEYDQAGNVVKERDFTDVAAPAPITPDTVIFNLSKAVCKPNVDIY